MAKAIAAAGLFARLRRWNRREPELVARLGGLGLMAIITQFNFHLSSAPDSRLHWTILSVLGLWALSSLIFQMLFRAGFRADRVRMLWSAADITCMTIVIKLLESVGPGSTAGEDVVHVETTLLVGYPLLDRGRGPLVAGPPRLDHDGDGRAWPSRDSSSTPHSGGATAVSPGVPARTWSIPISSRRVSC